MCSKKQRCSHGATRITEASSHDRRCLARERTLCDLGLDSLPERLTQPFCEPATENDALDVDQRDRRGNRRREGRGSAVDQPQGERVFRLDTIRPSLRLEPTSAHKAAHESGLGMRRDFDPPLKRSATGEVFKFAPSDRRLAKLIKGDEGVADLAGQTARALPEAAVEDQAGADTGAGKHTEKIVDTSTGAELPLGQGPNVHVVVQLHGATVEGCAHPAHDVDIVIPSGEIRRSRQHTGTGHDRTGRADSDTNGSAPPGRPRAQPQPSQ